MRRALLSIAIFAGIVAAAQTPEPSPTPTPDERVEQTKKDLEAITAKIEAATEKEAALLDALDQIDQEMSSRAEELADIQKQIDDQRALSEEKRVKMETLDESIHGKRDWLRARLRALYIHGRPGYLKVLFAAESYADLVRRTKFSRIVARRDTELVGALKADLKDASASRGDYEKDLALLESALSESRATNEELELQRTFRQSLLDEVKSERASFAGLKAALDARAAALGSAVGQTPAIPAGSGRPFAEAKGRLLPPVTACGILRGFGPYQHATGAQMMHTGIAWRCNAGEKVKAIYDGRVELSGWMTGYGQVVMIDHGDSWHTVYAHNSKLLKAKGDVVSEGEVIAETGDTGSFDGPFLFFSLYRQKDPVDPTEWFVH